MPVSMIEAFIRESVEKKAEWKRIRILGGEPTLHSRIFDIIELLEDYRSVHNPGVRLVLCTNYVCNCRRHRPHLPVSSGKRKPPQPIGHHGRSDVRVLPVLRAFWFSVAGKKGKDVPFLAESIFEFSDLKPRADVNSCSFLTL
jgi:hypothetical protein